MCPNCILNTAGAWVWLGPALICLLFAGFAASLYFMARNMGEFKGDEEEAKYAVFED